MTSLTVYRCKVCGYLHVGEAPEVCPMCGAKKIAFEEYTPRDITGTKTYENLAAAFAGESQANRRYTLFRHIAEMEGVPASVLDAFKRPMAEETAHALSHLVYMGDYGTTAENLKAAAEGEAYEYETMYRDFAETAKAEGLEDLAHYFLMVGKFENEHCSGYNKAGEEVG